MREVVLIRHGLTQWNIDRRIQGQTDIPLCEQGIEQVLSWRFQSHYLNYQWYSSPLIRTCETARLMGIDAPTKADDLIEMDWGEWTGRHLKSLRNELGQAMEENENRGLDFQPPGGESPRQVRERLAAWLKSLPHSDKPVFIVTHKGVIRSAISLATGWDLKCEFGEKLERDALHRFYLNDSTFSLDGLNFPLL
ncbi:MAG: phosphatase [marine bacterium B5-7]|nr:MAG: phosphatase [marine bacterium B5-7]